MLPNLLTVTDATRATLVRLELPESTALIPRYEYYTDYFRDITYAGNTYKTGVLKSIRNIKFTRELTAHKVKVQFTGLNQQQLDIILSNNSSFLNRSILISQLFMDSTNETELLNTPVVLFEGMITGASLVDKRTGLDNSSVIEWDCANHFQDFEQVVGRITDDFTHRGMVVENGVWKPSIATKRPEYASDKGFFHANQSINVLASYQTEEKKFKLVKKRNWHGLSSDVRLREYTEVVTKEVDIRFDLSAKFLPIVYGVQKVPSIPIFADTEKNDPSSVWVVYAICEGEIEGFYDIYFDDTPIICMNEKEKETRVCFGSKKTGGTINNSIVPNGTGRPATTVHGEHYVYDDGQGEINIWTYHGLSNQQACPILVQKAANGDFFFQKEKNMGAEYWDASFKLLDTAYIVINYKLSDLNGGRTSIPSVDVEVCGIKTKVYNNGSVTSSNSTSINPAWQLLDYLTSYRYGMSIPIANIHISSFEDVASKFNLIDTSYQSDWVTYSRYFGWDTITGDPRTIMQTNIMLLSEETIFKNVSSILSQTNSCLNKFGGKYLLQVESNNPSNLTIDLDSNALSDISIKDLTGTAKYNTVTASIIDPAKAWQSSSITFYDNEYKIEDRGVEKKLNLAFPYITNYYTARSMVSRELKKSRFSRSITFTLPFTYLGTLLPCDNVKVNYKRFNWIEKEFIVEEVEILTDGKISVTLEEMPLDALINSGQADLGSTDDVVIDVSVLPARDLSYVPSSLLTNPGANINGQLSWLPSLTSDVEYYTVFWDGAPEVKIVGKPTVGSPTTRITYDVSNLSIGSYTFTVKAVNKRGTFSAPVSLLVTVGASKYLPKVPNFRVINLEPGYTDRFINNFVQLAWDPIETSTTGIKYRLQILSTNDTILREVLLPYSSTAYLYTLAFNKQDYTALLGGVGAFRSLRFKIRAEGDGNTVSYDWEKIL